MFLYYLSVKKKQNAKPFLTPNKNNGGIIFFFFFKLYLCFLSELLSSEKHLKESIIYWYFATRAVVRGRADRSANAVHAAATAPPSCGAGQWQCGDGTCIPSENRCDRQYHCRDGTDEYSCNGESRVTSTRPLNWARPLEGISSAIVCKNINCIIVYGVDEFLSIL